jgi:hypothetical protein
MSLISPLNSNDRSIPLTYDKSEKSKKAILTHSSGTQSNLKHLFFGAKSKKSLSADTAKAI